MFDSKIDEILNTIYKNSGDNEVVRKFIEYTKEYIYELRKLGYINDDNDMYIVNILRDLKQLLPYQFYNEDSNTRILIDTRKFDDSILTKEDKIRLELYQKLGEYILNNMHAYNINVESNRISTRGPVDVPDIVDGFLLLNRAISQELAEQVFANITNKHRVSKMVRKPTIYEEPLESDFHINEILQEPAKLFAGTIYSEEKSTAFLHMTEKSLRIDFIESISSSNVDGLTTLLMGLGQIKKVVDKKYQYCHGSSIAVTFLQGFYEDSQNNKRK